MANEAEINVGVRGDFTAFKEGLRQAASTGIDLKINAQPLGRITGQVTEFEKSLGAANARVIAFGASAGIISQVSAALGNMVRQAVDVEKQLTDINSILNTTDAGLRKFGSSLFDIAANTGSTFSEVAQAAKELSRQGLSAQETLKRTSDALILTRLSGLEASKSVETLTATVNAFTKEALTSTDVVNRLANVDAQFAVSSGDLAEALSRTGAVAQDARISFNELIAAVTAVQQQTARGGAVIGNAFKTIFTRLERTDTLDKLSQLGIAVRDVEGNTLPAINVLSQLAQKFDSLSDSQKANISQTVAGVHQINILKTILGDLGSQYSIYRNALDAANGTTDEAIQRNQALNKTLSALANESLANFTKLSAAAGKLVFGPSLEKILGGFNEKSKLINGEGIGNEIGSGILKGIGNALSGPGLLVGGFLAAKLFKGFIQFAAEASQKVLGIGEAGEKQRAVQQGINNLLQKDDVLYSQILSQAKNLAQVEEQILATISQRVAAQKFMTTLAGAAASGVVAKGVTVKDDHFDVRTPPKKFSGFVPNLLDSSSVHAEIEGARYHGYDIAPSEVRSMNAKINGRQTEVVYNSREKVIPNFAGTGEPAIVPPNKNIVDLVRERNFAGGSMPTTSSNKVFYTRDLEKFFTHDYISRGYNPGFPKVSAAIKEQAALYKGLPLGGLNQGNAVYLNKDNPNPYTKRETLAHESFHASNPLLGQSETLARFYGGYKSPKDAGLISRVGSGLKSVGEYVQLLQSGEQEESYGTLFNRKHSLMKALLGKTATAAEGVVPNLAAFSFNKASRSDLRAIFRDPSDFLSRNLRGGELELGALTADAVNKVLPGLAKRRDLLKALGIQKVTGFTDPDVHKSIRAQPVGYGASFFGEEAGGYYSLSLAGGKLPMSAVMEILRGAVTPENKGYANVFNKKTRGLALRTVIGNMHPDLQTEGHLKDLIRNVPHSTLNKLVDMGLISGISPDHINLLNENSARGHIPNLAGIELSRKLLSSNPFLVGRQSNPSGVPVLEIPNEGLFTQGVGGYTYNPFVTAQIRHLKKAFGPQDGELQALFREKGHILFPKGIAVRPGGAFGIELDSEAKAAVGSGSSGGTMFERAVAHRFGIPNPKQNEPPDINSAGLDVIRGQGGDFIPSSITEGELKIEAFEYDKGKAVGTSSGVAKFVANALKRNLGLFKQIVPKDQLEEILNTSVPFKNQTFRDAFREKYNVNFAEGFAPFKQFRASDAVSNGLADSIPGLKEAITRETNGTGVSLHQARVNFLNPSLGLPNLAVTNIRDEGDNADPRKGFQRVAARGGRLDLAGSGREYGARGYVPNLAKGGVDLESIKAILHSQATLPEHREAIIGSLTEVQRRRLGVEKQILGEEEKELSASRKLIETQARGVVEAQTRSSKRQQLGFSAAFVAPLLGGVASEFISNPQGSRSAAGITNAFGTGAAIASILPGPYGLAAGGLVALAQALKVSLTNLTPSFEDLAKKTQEIVAKQNEESSSIQSFIQAQSQLEEAAKSGSPVRQTLAAQNYDRVLGGITDPVLRQQLTESASNPRTQEEFLAKRFQENRRIASNSRISGELTGIGDENKDFFGITRRNYLAGQRLIGQDTVNESRNKRVTDEQINRFVAISRTGGIGESASKSQLEGFIKEIENINTSSRGAARQLSEVGIKMGFTAEQAKAFDNLDPSSLARGLRELNEQLLNPAIRDTRANLQGIVDNFNKFSISLQASQTLFDRLANARQARATGTIENAFSGLELVNRRRAEVGGEGRALENELQTGLLRSEYTTAAAHQDIRRGAARSLGEANVNVLPNDTNFTKQFRALISEGATGQRNPVEAMERAVNLLDSIKDKSDEARKLYEKMVGELSQIRGRTDLVNINQENQVSQLRQTIDIQRQILASNRAAGALGGLGILGKNGLDVSTSIAGVNQGIAGRLEDDNSLLQRDRRLSRQIFRGGGALARSQFDVDQLQGRAERAGVIGQGIIDNFRSGFAPTGTDVALAKTSKGEETARSRELEAQRRREEIRLADSLLVSRRALITNQTVGTTESLLENLRGSKLLPTNVDSDAITGRIRTAANNTDFEALKKELLALRKATSGEGRGAIDTVLQQLPGLQLQKQLAPQGAVAAARKASEGDEPLSNKVFLAQVKDGLKVHLASESIQSLAEKVLAARLSSLTTPPSQNVGTSSGVSAKASGYIPAFNKEQEAINQGIGGARRTDSPLIRNIQGAGLSVINSGESVWDNFVPGKAAVLTRNMKESMGFAHGIIPNFASFGGLSYTSDVEKFYRNLFVSQGRDLSDPRVQRQFEEAVSAGRSNDVYGLSRSKNVFLNRSELGPYGRREFLAHETFHAKNPTLGRSETLARFYGGFRAPKNEGLMTRIGRGFESSFEYNKELLMGRYDPKHYGTFFNRTHSLTSVIGEKFRGLFGKSPAAVSQPTIEPPTTAKVLGAESRPVINIQTPTRPSVPSAAPIETSIEASNVLDSKIAQRAKELIEGSKKTVYVTDPTNPSRSIQKVYSLNEQAASLRAAKEITQGSVIGANTSGALGPIEATVSQIPEAVAAPSRFRGLLGKTLSTGRGLLKKIGLPITGIIEGATGLYETNKLLNQKSNKDLSASSRAWAYGLSLLGSVPDTLTALDPTGLFYGKDGFELFGRGIARNIVAKATGLVGAPEDHLSTYLTKQVIGLAGGNPNLDPEYVAVPPKTKAPLPVPTPEQMAAYAGTRDAAERKFFRRYPSQSASQIPTSASLKTDPRLSAFKQEFDAYLGTVIGKGDKNLETANKYIRAIQKGLTAKETIPGAKQFYTEYLAEIQSKVNLENYQRRNRGSIEDEKGVVHLAGGFDPVSDAVQRETHALQRRGIYDSSAVYVGQDSRVGVGVGNRYDEPFGISSGVTRVIAQGGNPHLAGLPNFAPNENGASMLESLRNIHASLQANNQSLKDLGTALENKPQDTASSGPATAKGTMTVDATVRVSGQDVVGVGQQIANEIQARLKTLESQLQTVAQKNKIAFLPVVANNLVPAAA